MVQGAAIRAMAAIDATHATVTTRERFSEELRKGSPTDFSTEPPIIGVRPPYESTVAYTMVKVDDKWRISERRVLEAGIEPRRDGGAPNLRRAKG